MQHDKPDKVAMSRALGAAFLSHQVEELEKSVSRLSSRGGRPSGTRGNGKRGSFSASRQVHPRGKDAREKPQGEHIESTSEPVINSEAIQKVADIIVIDASVLVYALEQLKVWCRKGRKEVIIIPLEVLNTLDILKKGSSPLAQRARAASRLLEAQVGTNPRIRVQRDDAFVLWDDILNMKRDGVNESEGTAASKAPPTLPTPPEWLRRTLCCVQWEVLNSVKELASNHGAVVISSGSAQSSPSSILSPLSDQDKPDDINHKVVLAVLLPSTNDTSKDPDAGSYTGRYERVDGMLIRMWAQEIGVTVLDIEAAALQSSLTTNQHSSSEKRRFTPSSPGKSHGFSRNERRHQGLDKDKGSKTPVVEKPIAMTIINDQPTKVFRVLARGEKLDP